MEPIPVNVTAPADAGTAPFTSMAHLGRSAKMKRPLIYAAILAASIIAISVFIGAPSPKWAEIKVGMKAPEIVASLGLPKNNLLDSKSIQIWENDGFIRTSSLAVLYYNPQQPEIATKTIRSDIWIWERL